MAGTNCEQQRLRSRRCRALLAVAGVILGSCSSSDSRSDTPESSSSAGTSGAPDTPSSDLGDGVGGGSGAKSPTIASDVNERYEFSRVGMTAGGWVTGIIIHPTAPDVMYARTDVGGAYRWNAADARWEQMITASSITDREPEADLYEVESVAVSATDPDIVYLSVGGDQQLDETSYETDGRVLRSTDGGRSWESGADRFYIAGNGKYRQQGERMAVDPLDAEVVFLGTRRQGIWISTDGGESFTNVAESDVPYAPAADPASASDSGISFITADPTGGTTPEGRTARWYAGVGGVGVMRTDDGGSTWTNILSVEPSVVPQEGELVEGLLHVAFNDAGGVPGSVQRYGADDGWFRFDLLPDIPIWSLAIDPNDVDHIMIATEAVRTGGLYISDDGGQSWSTPVVTTSSPEVPWIGVVNDGGYMPVGKFVFDPHDPGRVWFAEGSGVWTTSLGDPDAVEWMFAGQGIEELLVTDFVTAANGPIVSAVADFQGFVHDDLSTPPDTPLVDGRFAGGTSLDYVGGAPDNIVWIGSEYNIYFNPDRRSRAARSSDGGSTWQELSNLEPDMFGGNVAISAQDPDNIVWLPSNLLSPFEHLDIPKGLYATTDGGDNWTHLADVGGTNSLHRLMWWFARQALTADKVEPNTFYLFDDEEHFWVSTNGGTEWVASNHAPPCTVESGCHVFGQLHGDPYQGGRVWAAVGSNGLYRSDDAGQTAWQKIDGVDEVRTLGFGAPIGDSQVPALFLYGLVDGDPDLGIWRSADGGASFELIAREPYDSFAGISVVEGDMNVPGRVYVGFSGSGAVYGDDISLLGG